VGPRSLIGTKLALILREHYGLWARLNGTVLGDRLVAFMEVLIVAVFGYGPPCIGELFTYVGSRPDSATKDRHT
jgi:hypothetical protein